MENESPVNPIPALIIVLCMIAVGVELTFSAAEAGLIGGPRGVGWRVAALQDYAFSPAVLDWMIERNDYNLDLLKRLVTYPFVHGSFTSALFGTALLLALGKFVADIFGEVQTFILFLLTTIFGALIFGLIAEGQYPLFGMFPPVYGLIGAYTYVIWLRLGQTGQNQLQAFRLIGILLGIQLVFGLLFGSSPTWIAELASFAVGFVASTILAPGGWAAMVARFRQRR